MRETITSLIEQAQELSLIEMDQEKSAQQYAIASELYQHVIEAGGYSIHIHPSQLIKSGKGYRFIEQVYGQEFNDMVDMKNNSANINLAAEAVTAIELLNILRGSYFDSDRHGNQLRIRFNHATKKVYIGLYDFGEMSLEKPDKSEMEQFASVLNAMDYRQIYKTSFSTVFERQLSKGIETLRKQGKPVKYLMHIRKGVLALQDFYKHVPADRLIKIFQSLAQTNEIHPVLLSPLSALLNRASYYNMFVNAAYKMWSLFSPYQSVDNETSQFHITRQAETMALLECDQNISQSPSRLLSRRGEFII
jgi:hypothetical protein